MQTPEESLVITPEPTPEATPEPTISSTPEITPTATPAPTTETTPESAPVVTAPPTAEPTAVTAETPAAEPTPVVTDTVAPEPTPAATEEPTAEPTPDSGIPTPVTTVETPAPVKALSTTVPVAALSANKTAWSAPAAIRFYDRSTGSPTSRIWDFGDGANSTLKNPEHVYTAPGTYTVTLTVINDLGSDTTTSIDYIHVYDPVVPVAALSANRTAWSAPAPIRFYDRSTGFPTSWNWDFGDGTTSAVKNPEHVYAATGTYTVTLTVTNAQGSDTKVATDYITISDASVPVAALSANRTSWSAPAPIRFYDRSTGFPTSWNWDFGDGTTSTVKNPEHVYSSAGTYTVSLTVTNPQGSDTKLATDYITVNDPVAPGAALSANRTAWSAPAAIRFYDRSTGFPTSWSWDFGDGTTSTVKNPEHVYAATGTYTVTLTVTNAQGSDTKVATDYITVNDPVAPGAALSANKTSWSAPAPIRFYDRSTGFPTSWNWDFGDGTTSTVKNPEHVYAATGTYTVTLTVMNAQGSDTKITTDYITISDASVPVAALSANRTAWSAPAPIRFYDRSTGFPTSWSWDFGDGTTSDVKNPEHVYVSTGNYSVTLTVTNGLGSDTTTSADYIHVYTPEVPVAALSANKTSWSAPAAIRFYDRSTGFPTSWNWDFGDGTTSTVKNPEHVYVSTGNYTVTLSVTNGLGSDTTTSTDDIHIYTPEVPVAALSANKTAWSAPAPIRFYDRSTGFPTSWNWDFGDGTTSTVKNPEHVYSAAGTYTVTLTVTNPQGSDTKIATDYIRISDAAAPAAALSANRTTGVYPAAIRFYDRSTGFPTSWNWDFGDGATSTVKNPEHTFTSPGNYTINLTVTNALGSSAVTKANYIRVTTTSIPFAANFTAEPTVGMAPLAVNFTDLSTGFPASWNWSFGDGNFSAVQHPNYTFLSPGNFTVNLTVDDGYGVNDTLSMPEYVRVLPGIPAFDAIAGNSTIPSAMKQDQNVTVTLVMNNTGLTPWVRSSGMTPSVYLVATGNQTGDAAKFGPARIDIAENVSIATGQEYTFTWAIQAPNTTGLYHPAYQLEADGYGPFGPVVNVSVTVISNEAVIRFLSPLDDIYANETVNVTGSVSDAAITNLTLTLNGADLGAVPVEGGNFTASVPLVEINNVTVSAIDSQGFLQAATLLLDGDELLGEYEQEIGFDPLNPDSDNSQTHANEAGNGVLDGYERLNGDELSVAIKHQFGLNATEIDTDGDSLTDYFEIAKCGVACDPLLIDTDGNGISDAHEDLDGDGLTALEEQQHGTAPLVADSDGDTISDRDEIIMGTDPLKQDSDDDGLADNRELALGTNPLNPDSNGNGVPDGDDSYTATVIDPDTGAVFTITGKGDLEQSLVVTNQTSLVFQNNPARVGAAVHLKLNGTVDNAVITLPYDPTKIANTANLTIGYYNTTYNFYKQLPTTVDPVEHTVTATAPYQYLSEVTVLDKEVVQRVTANSSTIGNFPMDPNLRYSMHYLGFQSSSVWYFGQDFPAGHYRIEASGAYNNAVLPFTDWSWAAIPAWSNYGELGMWVKYGGGSSKVSDLVVSGNVLEFDHQGGPIGVWNRAITYSTCGGDATYVLSYVNDIDTDGDGIPNSIENSGFYDSNYNYYKTVYNNPDTDGDGLWDGVEAGQFWMVNGMRFYNINSMPTNPDSDSDILNDYIELVDEGTHPLMKDSDDDGWTDGEEVNHVIWPLRTEPLMPDTDEDGLIDSIDPDPLDAMNNTMPAEWHRSEFVQGLILSDISSSDPRHRNEAFSWGQDISQLACFGSARDLIAQAYNGKRGPHLMVLLAGSIPVGNLAKAEMKAITYVSKFDDPALRLTKFSRYSTNMGLFSGNKMGYLRDVVDKEGAIPVILSKGGTEDGLLRVMGSEATSKGNWDISFTKIADTLSVEGSTASWGTGALSRHYIKHRGNFAQKGLIYNTEQEYDTAARLLWNQFDSNAERYWDVIDHNVGVLDSQSGAYVAIDSSGILRTYQVKDIQKLREDTFRFIKIN